MDGSWWVHENQILLYLYFPIIGMFFTYIYIILVRRKDKYEKNVNKYLYETSGHLGVQQRRRGGRSPTPWSLMSLGHHRPLSPRYVKVWWRPERPVPVAQKPSKTRSRQMTMMMMMIARLMLWMSKHRTRMRTATAMTKWARAERANERVEVPVPCPSDAGKTTRLKFPRTIHMYMFGLIFIEDSPSRKKQNHIFHPSSGCVQRWWNSEPDLEDQCEDELPDSQIDWAWGRWSC